MVDENGREPSRPPVRSKSTDDPAGRQPAEGLVIVATPIGNRHDITLRALALLASVDLIACEDTRVTGKLLALHGIRAPLQAYHEHNAASVRPVLLARLAKGERIALVSDAGTPLVSDPGYKLVRAVIEAGIPVGVAPGPSAVLAALVLSGLPSDRFFFAGFLPPREAARRSALTELAPIRASLIFFEAPSRLAAALADMAAILGDRDAAVARELTKLFEEVRRDRLPALAAHYRDAGPPKGELVVTVGPPAAVEAPAAADLDEQLRAALAAHSLRDAVAAVAGATGLPRRAVYRRALALTGGDGDEP
jgi:16S rRNA (cytidine1402-2'-O)-methyltransferase